MKPTNEIYKMVKQECERQANEIAKVMEEGEYDGSYLDGQLNILDQFIQRWKAKTKYNEIEI